MKILVLHTRLSGYFAACLSELQIAVKTLDASRKTLQIVGS